MKKVKLIKPHTHAGVDYAPGALIEVDEATAQWLAEQGVIEANEAKPKKEKI